TLPAQRPPPEDNLSKPFEFSRSKLLLCPKLLRLISKLRRRYRSRAELPVRSTSVLGHDAAAGIDRNSHEIPPFGGQGPRPRQYEGYLGRSPDAVRGGSCDRREGIPPQSAALGGRPRHRRRVYRRQAKR